jgi:hypothetical protein
VCDAALDGVVVAVAGADIVNTRPPAIVPATHAAIAPRLADFIG